MKHTFYRLASLTAGAVLLAGSGAFAATKDADAAAWSGDTSDSIRKDAVACSVTADGTLVMAFSAQGAPPDMTLVNVAADRDVVDSPFKGDYVAAGVVGISFKIMHDGGEPYRVMAILQGAKSGRKWCNSNVLLSPNANEWAVNCVRLDLASGWDTDAKGDKSVMWQEDLKDVGQVGVRIIQRGFTAQTYSLAAFRLIGEDGFITPPATLTPLETALKNRFGVASVELLTAAQKAEDTDKDGMTDEYEIRSENDLDFAKTIFVTQIAEQQGTGITLRWPVVKNSKYTLFRASDLVQGFSALSGAVELQAAETGYMTYTDTTATGDGPYFYRVKRILPNQ